MPRPPAYGCPECGSVLDGAVALQDWQDAAADAQIARSQKRRLQAQRDRNPKAHHHYEAAMDVLRYWRDTCHPGAKELENERLNVCLDRLDGGYTPDALKRACYGYSLKPFVVGGRRSHEGPRDAWQADATLIFRDAKHVDYGLNVAERAGELTMAFGAASERARPPAPPPGRLSALGEAALKVARVFPIFPVKPREKVPMTRHGLKDAKQDEATIRRHWSQYPDSNIGVPTGRVSGVVVLDVDGDYGYESLTELEDKNDVLPDTKSVKTPRGGSHLFFLHPGDREVQNSASLLGQALDVRGDGGYVLVPPSVGSNGREYATDEEAPVLPMPSWLIEEIQNRQLVIATALGSGEYRLVLEQGATEGNRNDRLFRLACSLVRKHRPAEAASLVHGMNIAYVKPPLPDREVDQVIKSALRQKERGNG
jgi:hypothetical protein